MDIVEEIEIVCPQCGETFTIEVETTQPRLELIEDCAVCCRPMTIRILCEPGAVVEARVTAA
ncbi:MAG: CPXCG motif-containing cysteine-rich protein [Terrimicrobiaceae bacterium]|nr:CPXCG motif-containing cysteine-rich protein [Terrimicrobiaceae bacterium]